MASISQGLSAGVPNITHVRDATLSEQLSLSLEHGYRTTLAHLSFPAQTGLVLVFTVAAGILATWLISVLTGGPDRRPLRQDGPTIKPGDPPLPPITHIVGLWVYPIKSCRGMAVGRTRLGKAGLALDRNWMLVTPEDGKFLIIRKEPRMTLIDTGVVDGDDGRPMLQITVPGAEAPILIPAFPDAAWLRANCELRAAHIWGGETDAWQYGDHITGVLSAFFGKPVALVCKGPSARLGRGNGSAALYGSADTAHNFADLVSLLVASEASMNDLNARLAGKKGEEAKDAAALSMERFRPNIVVRGRDDRPWEEDTWKRVRITTTLPHEAAMYKIDLDVVSRCARCMAPNIDPVTAEKHPRQPWDEMMK